MYNILICDDDVDIVNALKIYLETSGYKVFEAYNGEQALSVMGKEDIVEISKANTGNLDVELVPCSAQVLLSQVAGEFEQRCCDAGLELITVSPESNINIMADSRRIWRVFENLMNNACKYSLSGSRVYLSLVKQGEKAVFMFRNTSKSALNISSDELMERFVRGDTSRNTEGNGLGLSIAQSLTKLQGGEMEITIDGDLFKVTLSFNAV